MREGVFLSLNSSSRFILVEKNKDNSLFIAFTAGYDPAAGGPTCNTTIAQTAQIDEACVVSHLATPNSSSPHTSHSTLFIRCHNIICSCVYVSIRANACACMHMHVRARAFVCVCARAFV